MLMKLTLGVKFINVFTQSFYTGRSRKHKKLLNLTVVFEFLGSAHVKAARKMLVKLTPGGRERERERVPNEKGFACQIFNVSANFTSDWIGPHSAVTFNETNLKWVCWSWLPQCISISARFH